MMPDYVLWQRGLRGPAISVMRNRGSGTPATNEHERTAALGAPVLLTEAEAAMTLDELAALHPAPVVKDSDSDGTS